MKNLFLDTETKIKNKLGKTLDKFTKSHNRWEPVRGVDMNQDDCENIFCASTQFLQIQKNQLIRLLEHLERYCKVLPVFGFNSTKNDLNLTKSYLLPIVDEQHIESTAIRRANHFMLFKLGDIQLLDIFLDEQQVLIHS